MGYVMAVNGIKPCPAPLSALAWASWGQKLMVPTPGAVMVYSRTGGGHVTLYESADSAYYYCRGGNQADSKPQNWRDLQRGECRLRSLSG